MRQILSLLFLMAIFTGCKDQNVNVQNVTTCAADKLNHSRDKTNSNFFIIY